MKKVDVATCGIGMALLFFEIGMILIIVFGLIYLAKLNPIVM